MMALVYLILIISIHAFVSEKKKERKKERKKRGLNWF